ncbi:Group II intron maturase-specific domain-containing protein [Azospirillaceae bacterium]
MIASAYTYFRLAQTLGVWRELDEWMHHRLRAIQLKQWKCGQWKCGKTVFRELTAMGAKPDVAQRVAGNCRPWWRNSGKLLNTVLTIKWADRMGMPMPVVSHGVV